MKTAATAHLDLFPRSLMPAFEGVLTRQRLQLLENLQTALNCEKLESAHVPGNEGSTDTKDLAAQDIEADDSAANMAQLRQEISAVDGALNRLRQRTFGVCTHCGEDIPIARLYAHPTATRCKSCHTSSEHSASRT